MYINISKKTIYIYIECQYIQQASASLPPSSCPSTTLIHVLCAFLLYFTCPPTLCTTQILPQKVEHVYICVYVYIRWCFQMQCFSTRSAFNSVTGLRGLRRLWLLFCGGLSWNHVLAKCPLVVDCHNTKPNVH